jgi:imidazolonepropionase-like amidohydrolase
MMRHALILLPLVAGTLTAQQPGARPAGGAADSARLAAAGPALQVPVPAAGTLVAITNATIMTASRGTIEKGTVLIRNGKIAAVGANVAVPAGAQVIDGTGRYVIPGIIDAHSHSASEGINEGTRSITAQVRQADVLREDAIGLWRSLAGGVTTLNILHGSANTIGGQNAVVKIRWGLPVDSLLFAGAPPGIKFALGENVRQTNRPQVPGQTQRYPHTRQGTEQLLRDAFTRAREYQAEWKGYATARKA